MDARWIEQALFAAPGGAPGAAAAHRTVGHLVPPVFDAYARIPHPQSHDDLDPDRWALLAPILLRHTTTPERVWAGRWEGRGKPVALASGRRRWARARKRPAIEGSITIGRWTYVFEPVSFAGTLPRFPSDVFWPADRAWFFGSEPNDSFVTYVGGARALIDEVLAVPGLGGRETRPGDPDPG